MVISRDAGCPAGQQGKYTSPGREFLKKICPLGGRVAKSYRLAHDMQQHDHPVYPKILFYNRDTSFLFHIWESPVCTSQLHETRLARDGGREPVWELPITMLLIEAKRVTINELFLFWMFYFQLIYWEQLCRGLPVFCFEWAAILTNHLFYQSFW